ncbi:Jag N-terminal domain-containing protein, partial [bacterium]|nr:Jag N-terminal domain-containing protein [bacterium]
MFSMNNDLRGFEFEGATVEDAVRNALKVLKLGRDEVIVKVVCEEKRGLFGMEGAKPAKIVVTVKEKE